MSKSEGFIFGIHAVLEALKAGRDIDKVLVRRGSGSDLLKKLMGEIGKREIPVQQVPVEKLNRPFGFILLKNQRKLNHTLIHHCIRHFNKSGNIGTIDVVARGSIFL